MKNCVFVSLLCTVLAQYGGQPSSYPSVPAPPGQVAVIPWYPQPYHHSRSDSCSHSRSDSRERRRRKCRDCNKLKKFRDTTIPSLVAPKVRYTHKKDCLRAVIRCPFDNRNYTLYVGNDRDDREAIATGLFIERTVKCRRKGKWEIEGSSTSDKYRFKYVGCQDNGIEISATAAPSPPPACTQCVAPHTMYLNTEPEPTGILTSTVGGCSTSMFSCSVAEDIQALIVFQEGGPIPVTEISQANLVCDSAQRWTYDSLPVTSVGCTVPACGECPISVTIASEGDASSIGISIDWIEDCTTFFFACEEDAEGAQTFVQLNEILLPTNEVTMPCNRASQWTYNGVIVSSVTCILPPV